MDAGMAWMNGWMREAKLEAGARTRTRVHTIGYLSFPNGIHTINHLLGLYPVGPQTREWNLQQPLSAPGEMEKADADGRFRTALTTSSLPALAGPRPAYSSNCACYG